MEKLIMKAHGYLKFKKHVMNSNPIRGPADVIIKMSWKCVKIRTKFGDGMLSITGQK